MAWRIGEAIVRREVWHRRPWLGTIVFVVEDSPDLLVSYMPGGAPFGSRTAAGRATDAIPGTVAERGKAMAC
ncbi:MAG: hypothetical protein ABI927_05705 [Gaiellaceae bacterium]